MIQVVQGIGFAIVLTGLFRRIAFGRYMDGWLLAGCIILAVTDLIVRDLWAIAWAFNAALFFHDWRRRGGLKKFRKKLGAKARALRAKLVRKMRELKPRPVLRPLPRGA